MQAQLLWQKLLHRWEREGREEAQELCHCNSFSVQSTKNRRLHTGHRGTFLFKCYINVSSHYFFDTIFKAKDRKCLFFKRKVWTKKLLVDHCAATHRSSSSRGGDDAWQMHCYLRFLQCNSCFFIKKVKPFFSPRASKSCSCCGAKARF